MHAFTGLPLAEVARVFRTDLAERFLVHGQLAPKRLPPRPDVPVPVYNMPDNAYMTGIWLATESLRYSVTRSEEARESARSALRGLDLLQTVTGVAGLLARAAIRSDEPHRDDGTWRLSPDGAWRWRGDVSSDQMDGALCGYCLAYELVADADDRALIARNVRALVGRLVADGLRIIDVDGKRTTWGNYTPEYCRGREPMNALLLLQHLAVATHVTGDGEFARLRDRLIAEEGYLDLARKARRLADPTVPRAVNHSDDVLLLLAFDTLLRIEEDAGRREAYVAGLRRMWEGDDRWPGISVEHNPPATFIYGRAVDRNVYVEPAIETLRLFPLDSKWNDATIAAYERRFGFRCRREPLSPPPVHGAVVPIDRRPRSWSAWVGDPYIAGDRMEDGGPAQLEFNGHDFLWGYWLGRAAGFIDENA